MALRSYVWGLLSKLTANCFTFLFMLQMDQRSWVWGRLSELTGSYEDGSSSLVRRRRIHLPNTSGPSTLTQVLKLRNFFYSFKKLNFIVKLKFK